MFERPAGGERAILVHLDLGELPPEAAIDELEALAVSAGAEVVDRLIIRRNRPDPRYFIGRGRMEEIQARVAVEGIEAVLVNHPLSPSQGRNLERALCCRVLDRTELILDIFAQRARSHEGKLQVELAQLRHMASRLVRGWTHLERQKGGIGMRGPGETQLEMDRRMLGVRIRQLEKRLQRVQKQREQGRQSRRKRDVATVSLVGYTNAGKSTLFNALTQAEVYADDRLFATLDTTLRRLELSHGDAVVLADTVGFIRDLPHQLVAAFRSTLEESVQSQLLLHVIDASDPERAAGIEEVEKVLADIGAHELPRLRVYNKTDLIGGRPRVTFNQDAGVTEVWLSAVSGEGLELLHEEVRRLQGAERVHGRIRLTPSQGRLRSRLFELGEVLGEQTEACGDLLMEIEIRRTDLERLRDNEGLSREIELVDA
nr:ribosome rescue GTPase HflX [Natronocella acetinitrilica]